MLGHMIPNCPEAGGKHKSEHKCFYSNCPWKGKNKASPVLNEISPNTPPSSEPELPLMHIKGWDATLEQSGWMLGYSHVPASTRRRLNQQKHKTVLGLKWKGEALNAFCRPNTLWRLLSWKTRAKWIGWMVTEETNCTHTPPSCCRLTATAHRPC